MRQSGSTRNCIFSAGIGKCERCDRVIEAAKTEGSHPFAFTHPARSDGTAGGRQGRRALLPSRLSGSRDRAAGSSNRPGRPQELCDLELRTSCRTKQRSGQTTSTTGTSTGMSRSDTFHPRMGGLPHPQAQRTYPRLRRPRVRECGSRPSSYARSIFSETKPRRRSPWRVSSRNDGLLPLAIPTGKTAAA